MAHSKWAKHETWVTVTTVVPPELREKLKEAAKAEDRSVNQMLRMIIRTHLDSRDAGVGTDVAERRLARAD